MYGPPDRQHEHRTPCIRKVLQVPAIAALLLAICIFSSCDDEVNIPRGAFDEHLVDLSGTWRIARVTQNEMDITERLDFGPLSLQLNGDDNGPTTYQIDHGGAPFVIVENGTWSLNDKIYPTALTFTSDDEQVTVAFASPPVSGGTSLSMSFVLGCGDNTYRYDFSKQ